jgi:predicted RNA binding protein YcfA (HicA-like mRNA interferase family)
MKVRDVLSLIEDYGWYSGSAEGQPPSVQAPGEDWPGHPSQEMDKGTFSNILKQAGLK